MATKPLIKCESEFPDFAHDFVAVNNLKEYGVLEEFLEGFVTKFGLGSEVRSEKSHRILTCSKQEIPSLIYLANSSR